uniref:Novel acetylcholine receptor chaperone n=1 Tax=Lynceus sp. MCZ IZ 141354 TaxID=1930659 RepID=A0A9N6ZG49_9CRUS|nr:EOG090X0IKQ [Lynceus sp. MCZ IZ 141354]
MGVFVVKSLSVFLGLFFVFVGVLKLSPIVSRELHKDLRKEYVRYAKVFPLAQALNFKVPPKWYRRVVGGTEIMSGLILAFIPHGRLKQVANVTLILFMLGAIYTHWILDDKFERVAPALVFFFMLTCRLIVDWQLKYRASKAKVAREVPAKETKAE